MSAHDPEQMERARRLAAMEEIRAEAHAKGFGIGLLFGVGIVAAYALLPYPFAHLVSATLALTALAALGGLW